MAGEMPPAPSPSLRPNGHKIGRRREKCLFFLIWPQLCQREGDAQQGWCCRQGSSWHLGDRRLVATSRSWEESKQSRDQHLHPGGDGAAPGLPDSPHQGRLVENGTRPHCLPLGTQQQTLAVISSNFYIMKIVSLGKAREGKWE